MPYISCAKGKTFLFSSSVIHSVFPLDHLPADPVSKKQPDPTPPTKSRTKQVSMFGNVCRSSFMLHATCYMLQPALLLKPWFHSTSVPEMLNLTGFLSNHSQDSRLLMSQPVGPPLQRQQPLHSVLLFLYQDIGGRAHPTLGLQTPVRHTWLILQETRKSFNSRDSLDHDSVPFVSPGFKHGRQLPVKPPPRRPAVDSISALSCVPASCANPPGVIKNIALQAAHAHAASALTLIPCKQSFCSRNEPEVRRDNAFLKSCH